MVEATSTGRVVAWTFLITMGVANIAGYAFDLYQQFWWFDRVLHACTILAVTLWLALFVFSRAISKEHRHSVLVVLMIASVGIALGALWEVAEWGFDHQNADHWAVGLPLGAAQPVLAALLIAPGDVIKGKHDTIFDIIMDTAGAGLAGLITLRLRRGSS